MDDLKVSEIGKAIGISKTKHGAAAKEQAWVITTSCCNILFSIITAVVCGLTVGYVLNNYDLNSMKTKFYDLMEERGFLQDAAQDRIMEIGLTLEDVLRRESQEIEELDSMDFALQELEGNFNVWLRSQFPHEPRKVEEGLNFFKDARETVAWYTQEMRRDSLEAKQYLGEVSDLIEAEDVIRGPSPGSLSRMGSEEENVGIQSAYGAARNTRDSDFNQYYGVNGNQGMKDWYEEAIQRLRDKGDVPTSESEHRQRAIANKEKKDGIKERLGYKSGSKKTTSSKTSSKSAESSSSSASSASKKESSSSLLKGRDLEGRIDRFFLAVDQAQKINLPEAFINHFNTIKEDNAEMQRLRISNKYEWQRHVELRRQRFAQLLKDYKIFDLDAHSTDRRERGRIIHDISLELEFIVKVQASTGRLSTLRQKYRNGDLTDTKFFQMLRTDASWKVVLEWLFNKAGHKSILLFQTYQKPMPQKSARSNNIVRDVPIKRMTSKRTKTNTGSASSTNAADERPSSRRVGIRIDGIDAKESDTDIRGQNHPPNANANFKYRGNRFGDRFKRDSERADRW
eukprot:CAMPEP_0184483000 /NCGR_PEP_ID=MMETSP0113_2-20130426/4609_1 /TAXON_ID=91329 /ORGANISM="Norrisiella sphaerica, Strain BC52" /LENGTH=568 /DNA_ID=CAMNT_0026863107 /DNA_START=131 /DNA_END=1837 /DNA_ORIENTATION=+